MFQGDFLNELFIHLLNTIMDEQSYDNKFFRGLIKKFYYNKKEILNIKKINSFLNKKKIIYLETTSDTL